MKKFLLLTSLLFSINCMAALEVNKPAPDFSLKGHDGKTYRLIDLRGKFVVLEWFNNDCPYVDKHYNATFRNMQNLQDEWVNKSSAKKGKNKKEVIWLAVISSAPGKQGHVDAAGAKKIRTERKAHMNAILFDPTGKVGKAYGAKTTPHMYIIDPEGKVRYNGAIDDKPSAQVKSIKGATNYVRQGLESLFMGKAVAKTATKPYGCSVKY